MNMDIMGKITISLSKEGEGKLRARAERNLRSISKEVEYMVLTLEDLERKKQC